MITLTRIILSLLFVLLMAGIPVAGDAAVGNSKILFVVEDYRWANLSGIDFVIEPLAYVRDGKLVKMDALDNGRLDSFSKEYYPHGARYNLFTAGKSAGSVTVLNTAFDIQCDSADATVAVTPVGAVDGDRMALASSADFKEAGYIRRTPVGTEKRALLKLISEIYAKHGVSASSLAGAQFRNEALFQSGPHAWLIGTATVGDDISQAAVFVIAERADDGSYRPTYSWYHKGTEEGMESKDLVDIVDLDGDGAPEIVVRDNGYEGVGYDVFRKTNTGWESIYGSFGSGC